MALLDAKHVAKEVVTLATALAAEINERETLRWNSLEGVVQEEVLPPSTERIIQCLPAAAAILAHHDLREEGAS